MEANTAPGEAQLVSFSQQDGDYQYPEPLVEVQQEPITLEITKYYGSVVRHNPNPRPHLDRPSDKGETPSLRWGFGPSLVQRNGALTVRVSGC